MSSLIFTPLIAGYITHIGRKRLLIIGVMIKVKLLLIMLVFVIVNGKYLLRLTHSCLRHVCTNFIIVLILL